MKRLSIIFLLLIQSMLGANALLITEIFSNPIGDDSGCEWIEVFNNSSSTVDLSSLSIAIKGGSPVGTTLLQGETLLPPSGYAVISSIVSLTSPVSKFLDASLGYPSYTGTLFKTTGSMSLVNTGQSSLDVRLGGAIVDSVQTYTPASEGKSLSLVAGVFVSGTPTPGAENQAAGPSASSGTTDTNQTTLSQATPPLSDIVIYLPNEKLVVAGAETEFSVAATNKAGKALDGLSASWAFGDGGQGKGTSTLYTYAYPGYYVLKVEASNGVVMGVGSMRVHVVAPEMAIASLGNGKYGAYMDLLNPNEYDLDVSQWKVTIGYATFIFPKNTVLAHGQVTRIALRSLGYTGSVDASLAVKITFPNQEEVTRYISKKEETVVAKEVLQQPPVSMMKSPAKKLVFKKEEILQATSTEAKQITQKKDARLKTWFKSFFS